MTQFFDRKCKIIVALPYEGAAGAAIVAAAGANTGAVDYSTISVNRVEIEGLRTQFSIKKTLGKNPNTAEVVVTNLADRTRSAFAVEGGKLLVLAGYRDAIAQIFVGDIHNVVSTPQGPDWSTKILAGDGNRAVRFGRIEKSFAAGVSVNTIVKACAAALGVDPGNLGKITSTRIFDHGYAAFGNAANEMTRVLGATGLTWSIQDGRLQVLPPGGVTEETIAVLSPQSGIIGSPEYGTAKKKNGKTVLTVKSLLHPGILPGRRVRMENVRDVKDGLFRVLSLEHTGDTSGGDWYTSMELEAI